MSDLEDGGTVRPIVRHGDPVLHRPCPRVERFDEDLRRLVADLFASMYAARGVGVAANQIGVALRVFVMDCLGPDGFVKAHVVNPVLELPPPRELIVRDEGCLSVPGVHRELARAGTAVVTGLDVFGEPVRIETGDTAARCLQHEVDHLDGLVYLDRLPASVRRKALREL